MGLYSDVSRYLVITVSTACTLDLFYHKLLYKSNGSIYDFSLMRGGGWMQDSSLIPWKGTKHFSFSCSWMQIPSSTKACTTKQKNVNCCGSDPETCFTLQNVGSIKNKKMLLRKVVSGTRWNYQCKIFKDRTAFFKRKKMLWVLRNTMQLGLGTSYDWDIDREW